MPLVTLSLVAELFECLIATLPLNAVAPVPSTVALQVLFVPVRTAWMPLMFPVVVPELKPVALTFHDLVLVALVFTENVVPNGPVQPVKVLLVTVPRGLVSPDPLLSVPAAADEVHVSTAPVTVSVRVVVPDFA